LGNISILINPYFNNENIYETNYNMEMIPSGKPGFSSTNFCFTAEGGKNFFHYLKRFNLSKEPDLLILFPNNHYYYEEIDLRNIRTLINLKKLNLIKDLDKFLHTLIHILPPNVNFIGCFAESKTHNGKEILSGLSNRFNNFLDSRTDHNMDKKDVSELLEKYGFKVIDMTEINELTYFYSQNVSRPTKLKPYWQMSLEIFH
jgi:hypothetical protein